MIHVLSKKFIHKEKVTDGIENIQTSYTMMKVKLKDIFSTIDSAGYHVTPRNTSTEKGNYSWLQSGHQEESTKLIIP